MNAPKVTDLDYIQFLIAAQGVYTCTEAARCAVNASHDAYTRLLTRLPPDTVALWQEVEPLVQLTHGLLVVDDSTLDKPYAQKNKVQKMGLVSRHWSGKHHAVVKGISLIRSNVLLSIRRFYGRTASAACPAIAVCMSLPKTAKRKSRRTTTSFRCYKQRRNAGSARSTFVSTAGTQALPTSKRCADTAGTS